MADSEQTAATLLDGLAALDPAQLREVASVLRRVAETFAQVPDGRDTAHTLRRWPTCSTPADRQPTLVHWY
jgi:hypothetical protein